MAFVDDNLAHEVSFYNCTVKGAVTILETEILKLECESWDIFSGTCVGMLDIGLGAIIIVNGCTGR